MWLVGVGGIYGCGCKEVYSNRVLLLLLYLFLFLQQHPYFFFNLLNVFRSLVMQTIKE